MLEGLTEGDELTLIGLFDTVLARDEVGEVVVDDCPDSVDDSDRDGESEGSGLGSTEGLVVTVGLADTVLVGEPEIEGEGD